MTTATRPDAIRQVPSPDAIRADLARNLRERYILRDLLRLAERIERRSTDAEGAADDPR